MSEKTLQNLTKAFIGESQARNRYSFYAKIAKKEGYEQIASIFLETAEQEKVHAKRLFEHIQELKKDNNEIIVKTIAPSIYKTTEENLQAAIDGETYEFEEMYPEFAKIAREEGLDEIAKRLEAIAIAENHHRERYQKILDQFKAGTIFKKDKKIQWICRECGYVHEGEEPPEECPSCNHSKAYFEIKCEEY